MTKIQQKYSDLKIVWHKEKLASIRDGIITAPICVRVKPTNRCNHRCFYCLTKGTMILTPNGSVPIETLKKGDLVISGKRKVRKVKEVFKRKSKEICKIDVSYLPTIYVSPEHPFLVGDKFIESKDLKKGMNLKVAQPILNLKSSGGQPSEILYLSKMFGNKEKRYHSKRRNGPYDEVGRFRLKGSKYSAPQKILLDYDFGRFCGLYLAEGNIHIYKNRPNSKSMCFSFGKNEKEYIEFIKSFCNRYGFKYRDNVYDYLTTWQVGVYNSIFSNFMEKYFGLKGESKRVPFEINMNHQFLKGLIKGFFDGDGCAKDYSMTSSNKILTYGILQLLLTQGIIPTFYKKKEGTYNIEGRIGKSKASYLLRISTKQRKIFNHVLDKNTEPLYRARIKPYYVKINSVELLNKPTEVFNIEVEEDNTYFAEFLLCHNCSYNPELESKNILSDGFKRNDEIPKDKLLEIIDDFKEIGVKAITLSGGGEPLLYHSIIDVFKRVNKNKIDLSIITNGQLLNGERAKLLKDAKWVRISLDACDKKTFNKIRRVPEKLFDVLVQNIKDFAKIKNKDCEFGINFVVNHLNKNQVYKAAKFFKSLGLNHIKFTPRWIDTKGEWLKYHKPFKEDVIKQIKKAEKELVDESFDIFDTYENDFKLTGIPMRTYPTCPIMQIVPVIGADSVVYFCHDKTYTKRGALGSIKNRSFKDLWFSKETAKKFKNFNPMKECQQHCTYDTRNILIQNAIKSYNKHHINFP